MSHLCFLHTLRLRDAVRLFNRTSAEVKRAPARAAPKSCRVRRRGEGTKKYTFSLLLLDLDRIRLTARFSFDPKLDAA